MNLHHLRVFHAVADAGGITAGALRLNMSQPAASREIRDFEARLAVTLLDRTSRGIALTEAGRLLFAYAQRIFALETAALSELRELTGLAGGRLTIGASNTIGNHLLPPLLGRFNARFPAVEVTMLMSNSEEVAARLHDERLTLGFVEGPFDDGLFEGLPIGRDPGSGTRANVDRAYAERGLAFVPALTVGSAEALKNLLLAGGIAWLPRLSVLPELRSGRLVEIPVADLRIERPLTMIWRRNRSHSPAAAAFIAQIRHGLGDEGVI